MAAPEGILRFIAVRPATLPTTARTAGVWVGPTRIESPLHARLVEAVGQGADRDRLRQVAREHLAARTAGDDVDLSPALALLNRPGAVSVAGPQAASGTDPQESTSGAEPQAASNADPQAAPAGAGQRAGGVAESRSPLTDLVTSAAFQRAEAWAADALVAAALLGETADEADVRTVKAAALARAVHQAPGQPVPDYGPVPVTLPDLVRRPVTGPGGSPATGSADGRTPDPGRPAEADPRTEDPRVWLATLETAHREITALVLDDRNRVDGGRGPAARPGSDAAPADPASTGPTQGTGGTPSVSSTARGFEVRGAALLALSSSTRQVIERLDLGGETANPVRLVARIEAEIQSVGPRVTGPLLRFDGGTVDPAGFRASVGADSAGKVLTRTLAATHSQAGVADLLVVRQKIKAYELGEFAHVENVMAGETRQRGTRRLTQVEEIVETEEETETEKEKDFSSTERNELQNEAEKTVKDQTQIEAGLQVSGSYGPAVSFSSSLKAGFSSSTEEAQRKAVSFSQEVTQRTAERVRQKVRRLTRRRTLEEFEETNDHRFTNNSNKHIRGVYRWLNKIYDAQIFNYGQRMMFDFVVPEPAAYFLFALVENPPKDSDLVKPQVPSYFGQPLRPAHLTRTNYHDLVARYRVANVPAPPAQFQTVTFFDKQEGGDFASFGRAGKVDVPAGYQAFGATVQSDYVFAEGENHSFRIVVGGRTFDHSDIWGAAYQDISLQQKELSVVAKLLGAKAFALGVDVDCSLTDEGLAKWQHQVYDAIIQAYQQQLAEYQERQAQAAVQQGSKAFGHNPLINRRVERDELKRWVIMMLTGQPNLDLDSFAAGAEPVLALDQAYANGQFIRFLENAFEWHNILYVCYPHFWGRRARWINALNLTDTDPDFSAFLRAGAARVQVPVRPGFEKAVAYYLQTGVIWDGNDVPVIADDLYVPIITEITENLGDLDQGVPYPAGSTPWEVSVPTDLVLVKSLEELPPLRDALPGGSHLAPAAQAAEAAPADPAAAGAPAASAGAVAGVAPVADDEE